MKLNLALAALLTLALASAPSSAQDPTHPDTPAGRKLAEVTRTLNSPDLELDAAWFSESFLQQIPAAQLGAIETAINAQFGELNLVAVEQNDENAILAAYLSAKNNIHVRQYLALNEEGLIEGLQIRLAPELDAKDDTWDSIVGDLT
ncbi:MAG: hypothetical protein ACYTF7_05165, partial [Planctomycetota bacterium]